MSLPNTNFEIQKCGEQQGEHLINKLSLFKIGEAAKLKPSEVELKRLEDLSETIVQDFARMRRNEEEMRDTNGIVKYNIILVLLSSRI